jgi:hypothetical protein
MVKFKICHIFLMFNAKYSSLSYCERENRDPCDICKSGDIKFTLRRDRKRDPVLSTTHINAALPSLKSVIYYACNETNLMHYLSSVYSVTMPVHVSGLLVAHHQEVAMYICNKLYVLY